MANQINGFYPGKLYPNNTIAGCIDIFENIWPSPEETIRIVENECSNPESYMHWEKAITWGKGLDQEHRTNDYISLATLATYYNNVTAQNIHNQMNFLLLATTIQYAKKHDILELYHEPYDMLRYCNNQEYKCHYDGTTGTGRVISAILYLNDDYEGGEIEFVNFNLKIKPKPGMLILFPSNYAYAHIAHPVTSGKKYAIVTWIKDRPL